MIPLQGQSQIISHDEQLPVVRKGAVTYVEGKPVVNQESAFTITCNVQPLNGKDLLLVPEGDRIKEQYFVWSRNYKDFQNLTQNDIVTRRNVKYQVQSAEDWGSYTKSRIMRIDVGPDRSSPETAIS